MVKGVQPHLSTDLGPADRPMANQKISRFKEIRQKEKHGGGGSIHDWQRVKSQF
jgi:hypothetical protein